jgi:membrane fusion protein (multidrug efflux system)
MADVSTPSTKQPGENPKAAKRFAPGKAFAILGGLLLFGAIGGFLAWSYFSQFEETDNATLVGHVHPVSARVAGTVQEVLVDDNQYVEKGQVLAVLDPRDYQITLSQAEHNLRNAQLQAETAYKNIGYTQKQALAQMTQAAGTVGASESGIQQARQSVQEAEAAVAQARHTLQEQEAQYQKALSDYQRYKGADPEAISAQQLDAASTALKRAEAAKNSALAALNQAEARLAQAQSGVQNNMSKLTQSKGILQGAQAQISQLDVVKSQYENAKAAIATAEDAVKQARLNLAYTRIVAPASGRVGRKTVEVGQRVQAGEPLMSIVGSQIWVVANYKETQLTRMRPGQRADVHIDAFPDHVFRGTVQSFSPASGAQFALLPPENATGNFTKIVQRIPVKILLDADSVKRYANLLAPGMSTVVTVKVK